jgi:hypothetical protein
VSPDKVEVFAERGEDLVARNSDAFLRRVLTQPVSYDLEVIKARGVLVIGKRGGTAVKRL